VPAPSAETAYLFRHALVRDAAYELHLPRARAALHALALDLLASALPEGGRGEAALELAHHAHAAASGAPAHEAARLHVLEAGYLEAAYEHAHRRFRHDDAISSLGRLVAHAATDAARKAYFQACLAEQLHDSGRNTEALATARAALAAPAWGQAARLYHVVASAEEALGNYPASEQACQAGLAQPDCPRRDRRRLQASLCVTLALSGRLLQAIEQAEALVSQAQDDEERAAALQILGPALNRLKRLPESRDASAQALHLHRQAGNLSGQVVTLINLGVCASASGEIYLARENYGRALALARQIGHRRLEGLCLNNLAATSNDDAANVLEAYATYRQALAVTREVGDLRRECFVLNGLSDTCSTLRRFDEARDAAQRSAGLAARIGAPDLALIARYLLGVSYFREGEYAIALPLLLAELPGLREEGHRNRMRLVLEALAQCHEHAGQPQEALAMRNELARWP